MSEQLAASISNDLTYNIKAGHCYAIQNRLHTPSYVAEKESQTSDSKEVIKETEIKNYILSHKREVLDILGLSENDLKPNNLCLPYPASPSGSTNSVKFKFENDLVCFSPTKSVSYTQSKSCNQTYTIHTNPHINVEAPPGSGGPNSLLSRL